MAEVYVEGVIGSDFWDEGVTVKGVREKLEGVDREEPLTVYVNSPGGYAHEGLGLRSLFAEWSGKVTAQVMGWAASAGSIVLLGADEIVMAAGSQIMIHDPWTVAEGNAADMRKASEQLEHSAENIAALYAARMGVEAGVARKAMLAETWYNADEAVAAGLADVALDAKSGVKAQLKPIPAAFNYRHAPKIDDASPAGPSMAVRAMQRRLALTKAQWVA
jgi:ATP-dependent protease ClpP protease subunit